MTREWTRTTTGLYQSTCPDCGYSIRRPTYTELTAAAARHDCREATATTTCRAPDCTRATAHWSTLCSTHEGQMNRYGRLLTPEELPVRITPGQPCAGCNRPLWTGEGIAGRPHGWTSHGARGFCDACRSAGEVPLPVPDPALDAFIARRRARRVPPEGIAA